MKNIYFNLEDDYALVETTVKICEDTGCVVQFPSWKTKIEL